MAGELVQRAVVEEVLLLAVEEVRRNPEGAEVAVTGEEEEELRGSSYPLL